MVGTSASLEQVRARYRSNELGSRNKLPVLACAFSLVALTFLTYWSGLENEFTWDGLIYVASNENVQGLSLDSIRWALTSFYFFNWHPLTWISYFIDFEIYGGVDPWGFHLTNLILHSLNVTLVFLLFLKVLDLHRLWGARSLTPEVCLIAAFVGAAAFSVHPQHVESVAWIAGRKDVLFQFFLLLSLLAYLRYGCGASSRWFWLSFVFATLAMSAKPMAITLPVILVLLDIYPLRRLSAISVQEIVSTKMLAVRVLREKIPFILLAVALGVLTVAAQRDVISDTLDVSFAQRAANAVTTYLDYLRRFLLPTELVPFYPHPLAPNPARYVPSALCLIAAISLSLAAFRRGRPWWAVVLAFYLVTLLPVIGLVQVGEQASADRYTYLPLLPAYMLLGLGIASLALRQDRPRSHRIVAWCMALAVLCAWFLKTQSQMTVWRDEVSLWTRVVEVFPAAGKAHANLAIARHDRGEFEAARGNIDIALASGFFDQEGIFETIVWMIDIGRPRLALALLDAGDRNHQTSGLSPQCTAYIRLWLRLRIGDGEVARSEILELIQSSRAGMGMVSGLSESLLNLMLGESEAWPPLCDDRVHN